jgi:ubiquinone/menaquinone biosynthesis C-methylase UbiE
MEREVLENHEKYLARKELYKSFGYDIDKERAFIIKQAQPIQGNILEAGTGKGHFALKLAKAGYRFTTFDISETEQAFAKLNLKYFSLHQLVDFRIENGECLSFGNKSFDIIFSINTFHHLMNPYKVLDELIRLLTFKGKLVLSDFTKEGMILMDKIHAIEGRKHEVSEITLGDIKAYLTKKNFDIKQDSTRYQDVLIAQKGAVK